MYDTHCLGPSRYTHHIHVGGYFCLGDFVLPGGKVFPILLVFVCAHIGGLIISKLYMPPLLGMLIAGVILVNIPGGILTSTDKKWLKEIKYGSLAVIFLRSGLEQDLSVRVGGLGALHPPVSWWYVWPAAHT